MERAHKVKPIVVHKEGAEGTLEIDALSGAILTSHDFRPDWADGLGGCIVQERLRFYEMRLGPKSAPFLSIKDADVVQFSDLSWVGMNEDGEEVEIKADSEYRSEVVAKCLGIDTTSETGDLGPGVLHEIEVDTKRHTMSQHERNAMQEAVDQGFSDEAPAEARTEATGTK